MFARGLLHSFFVAPFADLAATFTQASFVVRPTDHSFHDSKGFPKTN
jgi:hypothetical protein